MTATLSRTYRFEAAHFLPDVAVDHKCRRVHGHSYRVTVGVRGAVRDTGMVMDFADIDAVCAPLVMGLDHRLLNDVAGLENPTSENLCAWILRELDGLICVAHVEVAETDRSSCRIEVGA